METKATDYQVWQNPETAQNFLTGVRAAIPLATEQLSLLMFLIRQSLPEVKNFADLGCGNGVIGGAISEVYPQAEGLFIDLSEVMLAEAKQKITSSRVHFIQADLNHSHWQECLPSIAGFDVIVSGFAIHHLPDARKQKLYQEIYNLLRIGGLFLNLEHVASHSTWGERNFDQLFVDHLYKFHQQQDSGLSREEVDQQYYNRVDKTANILAPVEKQCEWLRDIGFVDVDCYFKLLEIALFGGRKLVEKDSC